MVAEVVTNYVKSVGRPNPFKEGEPGPDWWCSFLRRWQQLSQRKPEHLTEKRAEGVTKAVINQWIDNVSDVFVKQSLDKIAPDDIAKRLWNADETGLYLDATSKFVLAKRGARAVYKVGGGCGREFVTVLGCGAA